MLTIAALTLGLLFTSMKGHQMIEAATGCGWSGHIPGPGGSRLCPSPVSSLTSPVTPSYEQIKSQGNLWPCPSYTLAAPEDNTMAIVQMEREATLCVRILIQLHLLVAVVHLMVGGLQHISTG